MSETKTARTVTTEQHDPLVKAKGFWENYSKPIIYIGLAVILLIGGWYGYQNWIKAPKEQKANEAIFPAENLFAKMATTGFAQDSVNLVINGGKTEDGTVITGLLKIMNTYSGTAAANRAAYMTGAGYLHLKKFDQAIKYLKEFDGHGADQVQSKAYVMLGHAYAENKNTSEALSYYKKAAHLNTKDEVSSADALLIAAAYADVTGNSKEAIDLYTELKDKYPTNTAVINGEVDKYLARLGVVN